MTPEPKPAHLAAAYGEQFADPAVVAAYPLRPPHPAATLEILAGMAGPAGAVLDLGCGTGELSRRLAPRVGRLDAVDPSAAMLAAARRAPGGDHPRLTWTPGSAEDAPLAPPYDLVYAADSLHWMEWAVVLPRIRAALAPGGRLAVVSVGQDRPPWAAEAQPVIDRYSTNRDYRPFDLVAELTRRGLLRETERHRTEPVPFEQSVADYVGSYHARNGFSRDRMPPADAEAFDRELTAVVAPHASGGIVRLATRGVVVVGEPAPAG